MIDPIVVGLVTAGAVFLLAGAVLSVYGIALLGAVVGGASGFLLGPELGFAAFPELAGPILVGAAGGVALSYLLLSLAIGLLGFVVGTYMGAVGSQQLLQEPDLVVVAILALVTGAVAAFLGTVFKRTVMVFITSFIGATLASRSVTASDVDEAKLSEPDPILFDPVEEPLFIGLFVLGVLTQLGLFKFGYVTKLVSYLPGASVLQDREESKDEG
ncbi:MAG: hypothetical protein J07HX64_02004 [halophilic archaeon J07HX64]|jgi:hypothetical protein|nr:MAG: hypothetical protein J07HX64_02004 [halophilic archaeon J07HX64]